MYFYTCFYNFRVVYFSFVIFRIAENMALLYGSGSSYCYLRGQPEIDVISLQVLCIWAIKHQIFYGGVISFLASE